MVDGDLGWGGVAEVERLDGAAIRHTTPCGDGNLAWREWGKGPPLILLHGGFGSWKHWVRNIGPLSERFRVFALDLPGLGDSDVAPEPHTAEHLAMIVEEGIDRLIGPEGTFFLGAFSLGAVISSPLIHHMGERVRHAILIGAGGLGEMWHNAVANQRRRSRDMNEAQLRDVVRANLGNSMIGDVNRIDEDTVTIQLGLLNQKRGLKGLPISQSSIVRDLLPSIRNRVTLLWGEHDPYLLPSLEGAVEILRNACPGLDVRIVPDAGHWTNFEASAKINEMFAGLNPD